MSEEFDHVQVIAIGSNRNLNIYPQVPIKENRIIIKKDVYEPKFSHTQVFMGKIISQTPILGRWITKRRKRVPTVIWFYGRDICEEPPADGESKSFFLHNFTFEEYKGIVNRYIAKLLRSFKPISTGIAVIMIILLVINLILTVMGLAGVRIT